MLLIDMPDAGYLLLLGIVIVVSSVFNEYYHKNIAKQKTRMEKCVWILKWIVALSFLIGVLIVLLNVFDVLGRIIIEIFRFYI